MENQKLEKKQMGFGIAFLTWIVISFTQILISAITQTEIPKSSLFAIPNSLFAWVIIIGSVYLYSYVKKKLPIKNLAVRSLVAVVITEFVVAVSCLFI